MNNLDPEVDGPALWDHLIEAIRRDLARPPSTCPYDPKLPTYLVTDASRLHGLGFALTY